MTRKLEFTAQQSAALDRRDVSIGLSAGAGCGKTFVLKERFLRHVEPGVEDDPIGRLVAITFTERAAREMRDRIRIGCRDKLDHCDEQHVAHWMELLRGLDAARISTIHSFCASLLRAHAVEAQLDPQFAVLDAANQQALLRRVVKDSLYQLLTDHDPHCMQFIRRHGLERTAEFVRSLIQQQFRIDWSTFDDFDPETSAARWMEFWRVELIPKLILQFVESPLVRKLLQLLNEHQPSHKTMQQRRELLLTVLPQLSVSDNPGPLLEELAGAARVQGGGGAGAWGDPEVYETLKKTLADLREDIGKLQNQLDVDEADVRAATELSGHALHLVRYAAKLYEQAKQSDGVLDFDDLLLRTRKLLSENGSVRRRAACGIGFLMVDEFQDTDPVQTEIVRHLCGNQLKTGKLFLVGDVKQSIYRFRRADPEVFRQLRSELPLRGQLPLTKNFRSQPEILNFVNCVCGPAMEDYEPLETDAEQLSPTPAVEFQFATPGPGEAAVKNETAEIRRRREAKWIAARIANFLSDPTPRIRTRRSTGGGFELRRATRGDIAILFRSLTNVALYEEALREQGLDYYLVGGRAFYAQQEIYDWVNLCRFLDDADDEVSLLGVLRSPFFSLSDDTIFALATRGDGLSRGLFETPPPPFLSPEQRQQAAHARDVLTELRSLKDRLPLAELLNRTLERTGYDAALLVEYMGRRKLANLRKLIDKARQFDRTGRMTLKDFVVQLSESVTEQTDEELAATHPEVGDVIRLMTIHQSKGLEFPVVFVADMDWRPDRRTQAYFHPSLGPLVPVPKEAGRTRRNLGLEIHTLLEEQADADETIRLLYVALTRAADYLILSAGLDQDRTVRSPWLRLLSERFDLQTGLPVVDPVLGRISLQHVALDEIPSIAVHQQMPQGSTETPTRSKAQFSLNQLRELVERADPAPWPDSLREIPPSHVLRQLSVSQLEVLDAELHSGEKSGILFETVERDVRDLEFDAAEFDFADMTMLGTLVHSVLERIDLQNPGPLETLVDAAIAAADEIVRPEMRASMIARVEGFLDSSLRHELAAARRHFRELDFLLHWTAPTDSTIEATISGQIDCLAERADGSWIVVDYKTGRGGANDDAALISKYSLQLAVYAMAARQFIGRLPDRMELAIVGEKLVRIPVTITDRHLQHIEERMTAVFQRNLKSSVVAVEHPR